MLKPSLSDSSAEGRQGPSWSADPAANTIAQGQRNWSVEGRLRGELSPASQVGQLQPQVVWDKLKDLSLSGQGYGSSVKRSLRLATACRFWGELFESRRFE